MGPDNVGLHSTSVKRDVSDVMVTTKGDVTRHAALHSTLSNQHVILDSRLLNHRSHACSAWQVCHKVPRDTTLRTA